MINEVYKRAITREVLLKMLEEGIIPSREELLRIVDRRIGDLNLNQSEFAQRPHRIDWKEEASASKFNRLSRSVVGDLLVLYQSYLESEQRFSEATERALLEMNRLSRKSKSLNERVNRLLLTTEKTGGLLNVVGDSFSDASNIDQTRTTAHLDLDNQTVHGQYFRSDELNPLDTVDMSRLTEDHITVTLLDPSSRLAPGTRDSSTLDMFTSEEQPWMFTASHPGPNSVGIEVRVDFTEAAKPLELITAYKIGIAPYTTNNSLLVLCQHSVDGVTWEDLPVEEPLRRIAAPTIYMVDSLEFRYLRFVLTSDTHSRLDQNGRALHDFGIRRLYVHDVSNTFVESSELISTQYTVLNENGNRKKFTKASLSKACEHVENGTQIDYYIAFLTETLVELDFQKVIPLNREDTTGPQIAEIDDVAEALTTTTIDVTAPLFAGVNQANNYLLAGNVTSDSVEVWRNVGDRTRFYATRQASGRFTEDGWEYDGTHYNTFIYVSDDGGQEFDFGPRPIWIDSERVTGNVRLSKGVHSIRVSDENWYSLRGLHAIASFDAVTNQFLGSQRKFGDTGIEDDADDIVHPYRVIDPLYPFNHKLIIEGLEYQNEFNHDRTRQTYRGAARYASHFLQKLSPVDVEMNVDNMDYSKFAITEGRNDPDPPGNRILIKWHQYEAESPRESFAIIEKTATYAEGLVLKAVFITNNPRRTPSLEGYEIKIAE